MESVGARGGSVSQLRLGRVESQGWEAGRAPLAPAALPKADSGGGSCAAACRGRGAACAGRTTAAAHAGCAPAHCRRAAADGLQLNHWEGAGADRLGLEGHTVALQQHGAGAPCSVAAGAAAAARRNHGSPAPAAARHHGWRRSRDEPSSTSAAAAVAVLRAAAAAGIALLQ